MKITPRSSNITLFLLAFVGFATVIGGVSWMFNQRQLQKNTINELDNKKLNLERSLKELDSEVKKAREVNGDAQIFMEKIGKYQATTLQVESTGGTRKQVENAAKEANVSIGSFDILRLNSQGTVTYGGVEYIGKAYKFKFTGEYRSVGNMIAKLESQLPLIRVTDLKLLPANEELSNDGKVDGTITFIIVSNRLDLGPITTKTKVPGMGDILK